MLSQTSTIIFRYQEKEYVTRLRSLNILPLEYKFILSDLLIFHKIVFELIPIELPSEILPLVARTRSSTSVSYKFQINNDISNKKKVFLHSFPSRVIHYWNRLPDDVRNISQFSQFKSSVIQYLWSLVKTRIDNNDHEIASSDREPD